MYKQTYEKQSQVGHVDLMQQKLNFGYFLFHCTIIKAVCSVAKVENKLENSRFCHRPWNHASFSSMLKMFEVLEISQGQQERACYCTA